MLFVPENGEIRKKRVRRTKKYGKLANEKTPEKLFTVHKNFRQWRRVDVTYNDSIIK